MASSITIKFAASSPSVNSVPSTSTQGLNSEKVAAYISSAWVSDPARDRYRASATISTVRPIWNSFQLVQAVLTCSLRRTAA